MKCRICCRFPDTEGVQTPTWSAQEAQWAGPDRQVWFRPSAPPSLVPNLERCESGYRCPAFIEGTNVCSIYANRPLDCRLYPFVLTRDSAGTRVMLAMDMKCPYLQEHGSDPEVLEYALALSRYVDSPAGAQYVRSNPEIVGPRWPEFVSVAPLPGIAAGAEPPAVPPHPGLVPVGPQDRAAIARAFALRPRSHSGYTLAGLFGWSDLIRFWRADFGGTICLFAQQAGALFMPLPPLAARPEPRVWDAAWKLLADANRDAGVSRIEGVEPAEAAALPAGWKAEAGPKEYLYRTEQLAALRGDRFHSQRGSINKLLRRAGRARFRPFEEADLTRCLQLYTAWGIQRQQKETDPFPKALVRDGLFFHRRIMLDREALGVSGRVLELDGRLLGYTFGAPVSPELFCVLLEIGDPAEDGVPQLLFRELCREFSRYPAVNAMGDEGLPGLQRAKLGYHPSGYAETFLVTRRF